MAWITPESEWIMFKKLFGKKTAEAPKDTMIYLSIFDKRHHKDEPSPKFVRRWYKRGDTWKERVK